MESLHVVDMCSVKAMCGMLHVDDCVVVKHANVDARVSNVVSIFEESTFLDRLKAL